MSSSQKLCKKAAICTTCNKLAYAAGNLKQCSGCKQVWYCSEECQKKNWLIHKPSCKAHQAAHAGTALNKTNPVLHMVRIVTQDKDILRLVEFILIASLNLADGDLSLAKTHSVYFMTTVSPLPGHAPDSNGKQRMVLKVLWVQNEKLINDITLKIGESHRRAMLENGMPQSEVDKTVSANFVWQPWPNGMTVNYNQLRITPEKIKAFKEFKLPERVHGVGNPPMVINPATMYTEYLNDVFLSERYKNIATTRVDVAGHNAGLAVLHQKALEGGTYP